MDEPSGLQIVNVVSLRPQEQPVPGTSKTPATNLSATCEKPLLNLIRHLLNSIDNESNTSMTNGQLIDILKDEFDINIANTHNLEIEIYISVLKKFLKIWPRWDVLEKFVQSAKQNPKINLDAKLVEEYLSLKEYLKEKLTYSKIGAQQAVNKVASVNTKKKTPSLSVTSSQDQLYNLFFQAPDSRNTILNARPLPKTTIQVKHVTFNEVLHWPNTMVTVNLLGTLTYQYENTRELKHTLINRKLGKSTIPPNIPRNILTKPRKTKDFTHIDLNAFLTREIVRSKEKLGKSKILAHIKDSLPNLPKLTPNNLYKVYLNPYPYVRYFKNPVSSDGLNSTPYDLELEEYFSPVTTFFIDTAQTSDTENWLKVSCLTCSMVFTIKDHVEMMAHFRERHSEEADYVCANCKVTFQFKSLAEAGWRHSCASLN